MAYLKTIIDYVLSQGLDPFNKNVTLEKVFNNDLKEDNVIHDKQWYNHKKNTELEDATVLKRNSRMYCYSEEIKCVFHYLFCIMTVGLAEVRICPSNWQRVFTRIPKTLLTGDNHYWYWELELEAYTRNKLGMKTHEYFNKNRRKENVRVWNNSTQLIYRLHILNKLLLVPGRYADYNAIHPNNEKTYVYDDSEALIRKILYRIIKSKHFQKLMYGPFKCIWKDQMLQFQTNQLQKVLVVNMILEYPVAVDNRHAKYSLGMQVDHIKLAFVKMSRSLLFNLNILCDSEMHQKIQGDKNTKNQRLWIYTCCQNLYKENTKLLCPDIESLDLTSNRIFAWYGRSGLFPQIITNISMFFFFNKNNDIIMKTNTLSTGIPKQCGAWIYIYVINYDKEDLYLHQHKLHPKMYEVLCETQHWIYTGCTGYGPRERFLMHISGWSFLKKSKNKPPIIKPYLGNRSRHQGESQSDFMCNHVIKEVWQKQKPCDWSFDKFTFYCLYYKIKQYFTISYIPICGYHSDQIEENFIECAAKLVTSKDQGCKFWNKKDLNFLTFQH